MCFGMQDESPWAAKSGTSHKVTSSDVLGQRGMFRAAKRRWWSTCAIATGCTLVLAVAALLAVYLVFVIIGAGLGTR